MHCVWLIESVSSHDLNNNGIIYQHYEFLKTVLTPGTTPMLTNTGRVKIMSI